MLLFVFVSSLLFSVFIGIGSLLCACTFLLCFHVCLVQVTISSSLLHTYRLQLDFFQTHIYI